MRARSVTISYCYYYLLYYYYIIIIMISFCSRRVRLRFSLRFSLSQKFTFCVNSKIRNLLISAFHRTGEIDLQKPAQKAKTTNAYIMSKFENVLKAQKVKTTFFARFVVIILLLSRGFSSPPPPSFCSKSARARQCSEGLSRFHTFFFLSRRGTIRFRASLTHLRSLSLSFLFSTTHA